ncbi:MAG: GNAT family N-acetyltransferase [Deltaproteobacteria bacterium]|nr:GNAT family N-acetyltransferase [Deltaproteobacteria bacterium]
MEYLRARCAEQLPAGMGVGDLQGFLFENLKPYEDTPEDILRGLEHSLCAENMGFVLTAIEEGRLIGVTVVLDTGMGGYVPANLLLFVAVLSSRRGEGIGRELLEQAIGKCEGGIKLHVEYENPAKRLYERAGFSSKYAEMRHPGT